LQEAEWGVGVGIRKSKSIRLLLHTDKEGRCAAQAAVVVLQIIIIIPSLFFGASIASCGETVGCHYRSQFHS